MAKKKIPTPEYLLSLFQDYEAQVKSNPLKVHKWVGKRNPRPVHQLKERPLTYVGFECYVSMMGIITTLDHYFYNYQNRYSDFENVCRRIKTAIRADQIEGSMVGLYNSSITARITGLTNKKETTIKKPVRVTVIRETM